eukprot:scaffold3953_cov169-Amphora_coffeaeformis.AAC.14
MKKCIAIALLADENRKRTELWRYGSYRATGTLYSMISGHSIYMAGHTGMSIFLVHCRIWGTSAMKPTAFCTFFSTGSFYGILLLRAVSFLLVVCETISFRGHYSMFLTS